MGCCPLPGLDRSLLPGELEAQRTADFDANGIPFDPAHIENLERIAGEMDLARYWEE